jgi:hypothetical protein
MFAPIVASVSASMAGDLQAGALPAPSDAEPVCVVSAPAICAMRSAPMHVDPGLLPQLAGGRERIDAGSLPPRPLIAGAAHCAVMGAAERNRELVAGLAAECRRLHLAQVMRVGWLAAPDEAGLLRHEPQVVAVAVAARRGDRQRALVDAG